MHIKHNISYIFSSESKLIILFLIGQLYACHMNTSLHSETDGSYSGVALITHLVKEALLCKCKICITNIASTRYVYLFLKQPYTCK